MADISLMTKANYDIKTSSQLYNIVKVKTVKCVNSQQAIKAEEVSLSFENIITNHHHVIELKNTDDLVAKNHIIVGAATEKIIPKLKIEYITQKTYIDQTPHVSGESNLCGPTTCAMIISDNKGNMVNLETIVKQYENVRPSGEI